MIHMVAEAVRAKGSMGKVLRQITQMGLALTMGAAGVWMWWRTGGHNHDRCRWMNKDLNTTRATAVTMLLGA